jgi:hypothetical protein
MSSMVRSMRRAYARRQGTFVPQKPLRERGTTSFISRFMDALRMRKQIKEITK